ncbi:MAG: hypothetical protein DRJ52_03455, partial [Thermoprotei archaeon]
PSPVTSATLMKMAKKLELIPPERLEKIIVESAKTRLLNTVLGFVCLNCKWYTLMKVKDFIKIGACPRCRSRKIGVANVEESEIKKIVEKDFKVSNRFEERILDYLAFSSEIIEKYDGVGVVTLAARRLSREDIVRIAGKFSSINEELIKSIISAEKKALSRRFW